MLIDATQEARTMLRQKTLSTGKPVLIGRRGWADPNQVGRASTFTHAERDEAWRLVVSRENQTAAR